MTTSKFFTNITIHSAEDIKTAVNRFKSFAFVNNERAEATAELLKMIDEYNAELKTTAFATVTNSDNIVNAMIPIITLEPNALTNDNARKRAVYNAVSYTQYKVVDKNGTHELRKTEKAVTIQDLYKYLCDLFATAHADRKVTAEDKAKATAQLIPTATKHAFDLFKVGAYRKENTADKLRETAKNIIAESTEEEKKLFLESNPSNALAEKHIKFTAKLIGLEDISYRREHGLKLYKRAYAVDKYFGSNAVDVLKFAQEFIIVTRYAKNGIAMPTDKGDIFAVEEVEKDVITF